MWLTFDSDFCYGQKTRKKQPAQRDSGDFRKKLYEIIRMDCDG